ncbi:Gfo/Idh/MocA family oxidoreductase [Candidatus Poribacteria bacterium]|nr:Gfo/Idh/MocA family oxidoreductase [Candidatus Poribacteria bacterium]
MEVLRMAVIGTGGRAQSHLATIPKLADRYVLCGVCDLDAERAKSAGESRGVPWFVDSEELLDKAKPHVVLIGLPPEGHHIVVAQAASRGIHSISETPMSFSLACAKRMIDDSARYGTALEVSENVRRWPLERFKRAVIGSGALGEVTQIHCWYGSGIYHGISAVRNAARAEAVRIVGSAQNVQVDGRWFDPFIRRSVGNDPRTPQAPKNPPSGSRVATWELGVVTFANGVCAVIQYPPARVRGNYWEVYLTGGEMVAGDFYRYTEGGREAVPYETVHTEVDGVRTIDHMKLTAPGLPEAIWENPHKGYPLSDTDDIARADAMISVHRNVTEGAELDYGGIGGYRDLEVMIGTRESALRGNQPVPVPISLPIDYDRIQHAAFAERYGHDPLDLVGSSDFRQEAKISAEVGSIR